MAWEKVKVEKRRGLPDDIPTGKLYRTKDGFFKLALSRGATRMLGGSERVDAYADAGLGKIAFKPCAEGAYGVHATRGLGCQITATQPVRAVGHENVKVYSATEEEGMVVLTPTEYRDEEG